MKRKMKIAVVACLAVFCIAAAPYSLINKFTTNGSNRYLIEDVAIDASEASRTITENVSGFTKLVQYIELVDANTDVSALTVTCYGSLDGTNYGQVTSAAISSGTRTLSLMIDTIATSSSDEFVNVHDIWGFSAYRCIYATTGGTSADTISVQWSTTVGK